MIDYEATIKEFFNSVITFLQGQIASAADKDEVATIKQNIEKVRKIASNPQKYSNYTARYNDHCIPDFAGFMKQNSQDNTVFLAFEHVLWGLDKYYQVYGRYDNIGAKTTLLDAIKVWKYRTAKGFLQKITNRMKSPQSLAVHSNQR